jgi:hypothetical protein
MSSLLGPHSRSNEKLKCCEYRHCSLFYSMVMIIVMCLRHQGLYSKHLIFIVAYEWAHQSQSFVLSKPPPYIVLCNEPFPLACWVHSQVLMKMKCCEYRPNSLFYSMAMIIVVCLRHQVLYSQHLIFFVTNKWAQ